MRTAILEDGGGDDHAATTHLEGRPSRQLHLGAPQRPRGRAVARGLSRALMVVDMPFGSYEDSPAQAFRNAARLMAETGAGAVKLEGGAHMEDTIRFIVERGIPVMAHIGLTPQAVNALGGYRVQGRGADADRISEDARAVTRAGAFSVVLEKVPAALADQITAGIDIPTVGIGASSGCDGQILVIDDMLGLFDASAGCLK